MLRKDRVILEMERLKETSDILIVVDNEKLSNQYHHLGFSETFEKANTAIWNIITKISNEVTSISEIIEDNNEVFLEIVK